VGGGERDYTLRPQDPDAARELGRACAVGPATAQVLLHRGLTDEASARAYLMPRLEGLTAPDAMADRDRAAERLARAVEAGERICVFGDYDVDGTTSTAILADILEALGGGRGGYGLSDAALDRCLDTGATLLVTCDCGSSDHERISRARRSGVDVIVVDHHLVPPEPLPAVAFLNPHRPDCGFPYKGLASAGLALSVGAAVRQRLRRRLDLKPWLDLVALGTIADVAPLDGDNRRLVRAGLAIMGQEPLRPGIHALRQTAAVAPGRIGAVDVAFRIAPRLNAAGRLGDPTITLELLRAREPGRAVALAARIAELNERRRELERRVTAEAIDQVRDVYGERPAAGIVAAGEGWHRGVVGISAARLSDRFGVPAVVVALEDGIGHGSARTPEGFPLHDALRRCAPCLTTFGGHQAACGMSLPAGRVEAFRAAFADAVRELSPPEVGPERPTVDVRLDGTTYPIPTARDLHCLEPLGAANAEPLFALPGVRIDHRRTVGDGDRHLKLRLRVGRRGLWAFGYELGYLEPTLGDVVDALGHVRLDTWRGGGAIELRLRSVLPPTT